jgi:hypothetical protein
MLTEIPGSWVGPSAAGNAIYVSQLARFIEFISRMQASHWSVVVEQFSTNRDSIERAHLDAIDQEQAHDRTAGYPARILAADIADPHGARVPVGAATSAIATRDLIAAEDFDIAFTPFSKFIIVEHLAPEILASPRDPGPYGPNGETVVRFLDALRTFLPFYSGGLQILAGSDKRLSQLGDAADRAQAAADRSSRRLTIEIVRSVTTEVVIALAMAEILVNDRIAVAVLNCKGLAATAAAAVALQDLISVADYRTLVGPFADMMAPL